jgi:hypothetical protein
MRYIVLRVYPLLSLSSQALILLKRILLRSIAHVCNTVANKRVAACGWV